MNKALLKYEIRDNLSGFASLFIYGIVLGGLLWILDKEFTMANVDAMCMTYFFCVSDMMQIASINGHMCFGYSRKIQFRNRFFAGVVVAAFLTLIRTVVLLLAYDNYIQLFIKDTKETADMYHTPFVLEVFFVNFLLFEFIMLVKLIAKTTVIYSTKNAYTVVMQERAARLGKKCTAVKVGFFILAIVALVPFVMLYIEMYGMLCQDNGLYHAALIFGFLIADIILYFIAKKRYSPEYI